jgi:tetratricopeptide (TPR) repeat protein
VLEYQAGRPAEAEAALVAAIERFRAIGDTAGLALALRSCGLVHILGGRFVDADAALAEAQELYIANGDARGLAWVNQHRAWTSFVGGDVDGADSRLDEAEASFGALGDPNGLSWVLGLRGFIRFRQGRLDEAEALAVANLRGAEEHGEAWAAAMMRVLLAGLRLWSGRVAGARELAEEARVGFRSIRDRFGEAQALGTLVRAEIAAGRPADALRELERLSSAADTDPRRAWAALVAAGAYAHLGEGHRAVAQVEQALELLDPGAGSTTGLSATELWSAMTLARLQIADVDGALAAADRALDTRGDAPYAAAAAAAAYAAGGRRAEAIELAQRSLAHPAASYLDQAVAAATVALAADGAVSADARTVLGEIAAGTEDVLAARIAVAVEHLLRDAAEGAATAGDGAAAESSAGVLPDGWGRALLAIVDGARSGEPSALPN